MHVAQPCMLNRLNEFFTLFEIHYTVSHEVELVIKKIQSIQTQCIYYKQNSH